MSKKSQNGVFYTENWKVLLHKLDLQDLLSSKIKSIIEPFCGQGDLLTFIYQSKKYIDENKIRIECYDKDPKKENIITRNTLLNPPNYDNKIIITNPPYLARNKSVDKTIYNLYKTDDLYKAFLKSFMDSSVQGGILIIPINFLSGIKKSDTALRTQFLSKFKIQRLNVFMYQVFSDTSYNVVSFQFTLNPTNKQTVETYFHLSPDYIERESISLNQDYGYLFGGEIYNLKGDNKIKIGRLVKGNNKNIFITSIFLNGLDNICLEYKEEPYYGKLTDRCFATITSSISIPLKSQKRIINLFNGLLNKFRKKYRDMFLTNYRDKYRKRISFTLVYNIIEYIIFRKKLV